MKEECVRDIHRVLLTLPIYPIIEFEQSFNPLELWTHRCAESHVRAIEVIQFGVAEEDAVYAFALLSQSDPFVAENFADKNLDPCAN